MNKLTFATLCAVLALSACKGGDDADTEDSDPPPACEFTVTNADPPIGATGVYFRSDITVTLSAVDPSAAITVESGGVDVPGIVTTEGSTLTFEPDPNFLPGASHTATVHLCDDTSQVDIEFTTSDIGTNVSPDDVVGQAYLLDLTNADFVEPAGVGPLLAGQLTVDILLGVLSANATEVGIVGALGEEGALTATQDLCQPTIDFPVASFTDNPYFEVGPDDTTITVQGIDITIDDLFVSGAFAPGGESIEGAVLEGSIDTRPLVGLIGGGEEDAVCALVSTFGITCQPCIGGGDFCLGLVVQNIQADSVEGETLVFRTQAEIDADLDCTPPEPDPVP